MWSLTQKSALGIWIFSFIHVHTFHRCLSGDFSYTLSSCLPCLWQRQVSNMCNDFLLTVCKGHTGDYWLAAMAVPTSSTAKSMQMAKGQYLTVWFEQTRLVSTWAMLVYWIYHLSKITNILKCHYDENCIFSIKAILKQKQVACMRREMLYTIFKYPFLFQRYWSF